MTTFTTRELTPRELAISTSGVECADETIRAGEQLAPLIAGALADSPEVSWPQRRSEGLMGKAVRLPRARTIEVAGVPVRLLEPEGPVRGTYLHLHGGGWCVGSHDTQDARLAALADETGARVLSIGYRLAPEDPYPAAVDDAVAVAGDVTRDEGPFVIGGESAGAHLAVLTLLRLRDEGVTPFSGAVLTFGAFDLAGTPSRGEGFGGSIELWLRDVPAARRRAPHVSPLYADLEGLPPARIMVGTRDSLIDDSLMLAARWQQVAEVELDIVAGAHHGFTLQDITATRTARAAEHAFITRALAGARAELPA